LATDFVSARLRSRSCSIEDSEAALPQRPPKLGGLQFDREELDLPLLCWCAQVGSV